MFRKTVLEHSHQNDRDYECSQAENLKAPLKSTHGFRHRIGGKESVYE
jgi:hypothetical protein